MDSNLEVLIKVKKSLLKVTRDLEMRNIHGHLDKSLEIVKSQLRELDVMIANKVME